MSFLNPEDVIKDSCKVVEIYVKWPSFHDYEIVRVIFDRNSPEGQRGPHITIYFHMWEIVGKSTEGKSFKYDKHNVVGILFRNVGDYTEQGFNQQNVINDIGISLTHDESNNSLYNVLIPDLYGVGFELTCRSIEVVSLERGVPKFSGHQ